MDNVFGETIVSEGKGGCDNNNIIIDYLICISQACSNTMMTFRFATKITKKLCSTILAVYTKDTKSHEVKKR